MPYSDMKLAQMGRRREELGEQIKALKERQALIDGKILAELERRDTRTLETGGVKLTAVRNENVSYDFDGLVDDLGPAKAKKIQKREVDKKLLAEQVQAGKIDGALVARNSSVTFSAPYLRVS